MESGQRNGSFIVNCNNHYRLFLTPNQLKMLAAAVLQKIHQVNIAFCFLLGLRRRRHGVKLHNSTL